MADVLGSPAQPPGSAPEPRLLGGALDAGGRLLGGLASVPGRILGGIGDYFTSPIQGGDPSLSGGQNAALRIADVLSRLGPPGPQSAGANSPLLRHVALQQQQAQQRRQDFMQNLSALAKIGDFLDSTPIQGREDRLKELRERYGQFSGPGSEVLFDAVFGDPASAQGVLAELAQDPEIQQRIAQGASVEEIQALRQSPEFQARAQERQDEQLLPAVEQKIQGLLSAPSPVLRQALERAQRDGKITVEELRKLNEIAGQGSEGFALTPSEFGTLERRQADIASRVDGFATSDQIAASEKQAAEREKFTFEEKLRQEGRERLERAKREGKTDGPTAGQKATAAFKLATARKAYDSKEFAIRTALESPPSGTGDLVQLMTLINNIDNTAAREGEVDTQRDTQSLMSRLQGIAENLRSGAAYGPDKRAEVQGILRQMLESNRAGRSSYFQRMGEALDVAGYPSELVAPFRDAPAPEGSPGNAPERRQVKTPEGETVVERGENGRWDEVSP